VAGIAGIPSAVAQSIAWESSVYATVPAYGSDVGSQRASYPHASDMLGDLVQSPFLTRSDPTSRAVMLLSTAGEPGIVLAGRAQIAEGDRYVPATPWIVKISTADNHVLWTWHFPFDTNRRGRFLEAAVDQQGDVVAIGGQSYTETTGGFLLVKLDGATGDMQWHVDGPEGLGGYGVAFDAQGNVVMTAAKDGQQVVSRYAGGTGELVWSTSLPDAQAVMDDFLVATNDSGDVAAAGQYRESETDEYGVRVARFNAANGMFLWERRFPGTFMSSAAVLRQLPDGDVLLIGSLDEGGPFARFAGDTGETRWQRGDIGSSDIRIDAAEQLVVAGYASGVADIQRIDASTGQTLWRRQMPGRFYTAVRSLSLGTDGNPIIALSDGDDWIPFEAAGLDLATGTLRWLSVPRRGGYVTEDDFPVGILQANDGSVYFGGYDHGVPGEATWTVFKLAPIAADTVYTNGYD
jgi:outer membrane protein assembly factor BamB